MANFFTRLITRSLNPGGLDGSVQPLLASLFAPSEEDGATIGGGSDEGLGIDRSNLVVAARESIAGIPPTGNLSSLLQRETPAFTTPLLESFNDPIVNSIDLDPPNSLVKVPELGLGAELGIQSELVSLSKLEPESKPIIKVPLINGDLGGSDIIQRRANLEAGSVDRQPLQQPLDIQPQQRSVFQPEFQSDIQPPQNLEIQSEPRSPQDFDLESQQTVLSQLPLSPLVQSSIEPLIAPFDNAVPLDNQQRSTQNLEIQSYPQQQSEVSSEALSIISSEALLAIPSETQSELSSQTESQPVPLIRSLIDPLIELLDQPALQDQEQRSSQHFDIQPPQNSATQEEHPQSQLPQSPSLSHSQSLHPVIESLVPLDHQQPEPRSEISNIPSEAQTQLVSQPVPSPKSSSRNEMNLIIDRPENIASLAPSIHPLMEPINQPVLPDQQQRSSQNFDVESSQNLDVQAIQQSEQPQSEPSQQSQPLQSLSQQSQEFHPVIEPIAPIDHMVSLNPKNQIDTQAEIQEQPRSQPQFEILSQIPSHVQTEQPSEIQTQPFQQIRPVIESLVPLDHHQPEPRSEISNIPSEPQPQLVSQPPSPSVPSQKSSSRNGMNLIIDRPENTASLAPSIHPLMEPINQPARPDQQQRSSQNLDVQAKQQSQLTQSQPLQSLSQQSQEFHPVIEPSIAPIDHVVSLNPQPRSKNQTEIQAEIQQQPRSSQHFDIQSPQNSATQEEHPQSQLLQSSWLSHSQSLHPVIEPLAPLDQQQPELRSEISNIPSEPQTQLVSQPPSQPVPSPKSSSRNGINLIIDRLGNPASLAPSIHPLMEPINQPARPDQQQRSSQNFDVESAQNLDVQAKQQSEQSQQLQSISPQSQEFHPVIEPIAPIDHVVSLNPKNQIDTQAELQEQPRSQPPSHVQTEQPSEIQTQPFQQIRSVIESLVPLDQQQPERRSEISNIPSEPSISQSSASRPVPLIRPLEIRSQQSSQLQSQLQSKFQLRSQSVSSIRPLIEPLIELSKNGIHSIIDRPENTASLTPFTFHLGLTSKANSLNLLKPVEERQEEVHQSVSTDLSYQPQIETRGGLLMPRSSSQPPTPTINITIGRIEVRASPPPPPSRSPRSPARPALSLDAYLKQRGVSDE